MPYIINEDFEPIGSDKKDLKHFGVLGMKWGVRRHRRAASVARKDAADLRKHGFTKEAAALDKNASALEKKIGIKEAKIKSKQSDIQKDLDTEDKFVDKNRETLGNKNVERIVRDANNRAADTWKPGMSVRQTIDTILDQNRKSAEKAGMSYDAASDKKFWDSLFEQELAWEDS